MGHGGREVKVQLVFALGVWCRREEVSWGDL